MPPRAEEAKARGSRGVRVAVGERCGATEALCLYSFENGSIVGLVFGGVSCRFLDADLSNQSQVFGGCRVHSLAEGVDLEA